MLAADWDGGRRRRPEPATFLLWDGHPPTRSRLPFRSRSHDGSSPHRRPGGAPLPRNNGPIKLWPRPNHSGSFNKDCGSRRDKPGWPPEASKDLPLGVAQAGRPALADPHFEFLQTAAPRRRWLAAVPGGDREGGGDPARFLACEDSGSPLQHVRRWLCP